MPTWLQPSADGVIIALYVQPRASKNAIVGVQGEELKVHLTSPPVEGAANRLCCEFFAKLLQVAKSDVRLHAGEKSRHKRLLIRNISPDLVEQRLASLFG